MIDLLELINKDSEVEKAVDLIVSSHVEFDVDDLGTMTEEQYAVVEPFYSNAIKEILSERIEHRKRIQGKST